MENELERVIAARSCPHLAMLLRSTREVYSAQASFYGLGARRNGWILHRAIPGRLERDREGLKGAGLDVEALESSGQMVIDEAPINEPPETWARRWVAVADAALHRGFDAVWWTGPPIPASDDIYQVGFDYDRALEQCIHGHPAVTMCMYIVGGLSEEEQQARAEELSRIHHALLMSGPNGVTVLETLLMLGKHERPAPAPAERRDEGIGSDLSDRELEVLQLMAEGLRNREIAATLFISEATVKTHVRHILEKLRIRNRAEAAAFAARWLPPPHALAVRRP